MTDNIENLTLEHLKRFQATLDRMERKQDELIGRVANLEGALASLMQHLAHLSAADAAQQVAIATSVAGLTGSSGGSNWLS